VPGRKLGGKQPACMQFELDSRIKLAIIVIIITYALLSVCLFPTHLFVSSSCQSIANDLISRSPIAYKLFISESTCFHNIAQI
jgi:hypothetical protein